MSDTSVKCPSCGIGAWKPKARGIRTCPHCAVKVRLTKQGSAFADALVIERLGLSGGRPALNPSKPLFPVNAGTNYASKRKAHIYHVIDSEGRIACAGCAHWTTYLDSTDGHLNGDGLMRVDRAVRDSSGMQVGIETVYIPANVRGRFCPACVAAFPVRPVGRLAPKDTRFSLGYETTAELVPFKPKGRGRTHITRQLGSEQIKGRLKAPAGAPETWRYKVEKDKDPNPEWAHTFDATWLACSTPGRVFGKDDVGDDRSDKWTLEPVGRHPIACGCPRCARYEHPATYAARVYTAPSHNGGRQIAHVRDSRIDGPVVSLPPRCERRRVRWESDVPHVPQSANRIVGRGGRGARLRTHPADGIIAAIRAAIRAGMADTAYVYARMLARTARA